MKWRKRGLVWGPDKSKPWAISHAMCPTPVKISNDVLRVYVTTLDALGRGNATFVDVSAFDPTLVLQVPEEVSLAPGQAGTFDDNGVVPISYVDTSEGMYMYYAGYELCAQVPYRILTGLAISKDGGLRFERYSNVPILDRSHGEIYFRGGPFALHEDGIFKLWYVSGDRWLDIDGKSMPVYNLRFLTSVDGKAWPPNGRVVLDLDEAEEHGFGRPYVRRMFDGRYQLFYSVRKKTVRAYRLGYAESDDGVNWVRKDNEMGLDVSPGSFDGAGIMYSTVITVHGKTYCFYNGNNFGQEGFAVAELDE